MLTDFFPGASPWAIQRALDKAVELDAPIALLSQDHGELTLAVPSASAPDHAHIVRLDARGHPLRCTCEAAGKPVCWHRAAALLWLAEHRSRPAKPMASSRLRRVDLI
jgi:hypothetical protein